MIKAFPAKLLIFFFFLTVHHVHPCWLLAVVIFTAFVVVLPPITAGEQKSVKLDTNYVYD